MSLKTTLDRIINIYGEDIVHKKISQTTNDYGELTDEIATEETIKAIVGGSVDRYVLQELFGISEDLSSSLLISADIQVDPTDIFVLDGSEIKPKNIRKVKYKGEHVLTILAV